MAANSSAFHESEDILRPATRDLHRALVSLMEELEAIDWYQAGTSNGHEGANRESGADRAAATAAVGSLRKAR